MTVTRARAQRAPSTTPLLLRRLRTAMVILTLLAGAVAALLAIEEHAVVSSGEHSATAVIQAFAAHQALADSDSEAVQTIPRGGGPAGQYQDDIATAEQDLEQVAENNTAGAAGTDALQLIEGLLPSYTGLIEQADARTQVPGDNGAAADDLWQASDLMLGQILTDQQSTENDSVSDLQSAENRSLTAQQSSPWASPWLSLSLLLPAVALLVTLAATQRVLQVRMHRVLSKYLTIAAAAVIALCVVAGHILVSEHSFRMASGPLATIVAEQDHQAASADLQVQTGLSQLIGGKCVRCTATQQAAHQLVAAEIKALAPPRRPAAMAACPPGDTAAACVTAMQDEVTADGNSAAQARYGLSLVLIAALTAALLLLIPLGLWRYLDEYRYQEA